MEYLELRSFSYVNNSFFVFLFCDASHAKHVQYALRESNPCAEYVRVLLGDRLPSYARS